MGIPSYHTEAGWNVLTVEQLAVELGCEWERNGGLEIKGAAALEDASAADLSFVANRKAAGQANSSGAGCLIVPPGFDAGSRTVIRSPQPRNAFARALLLLYPEKPAGSGIHATAIVASSASIGRDCWIGPHVTIGEDARIGAGCRIGEGSSIGRGVHLGSDCRLHANVTLYAGAQVGARAILHSGCVIGADGFGFAFEKDHYEKFPQVGSVRLGDDVEIGANSCIDRAALGWTTIGDGTKLDNMVHIGHNCRIGRHVVIAAQTGLSGGVIVEDYAVIGGQVGIGDKARIESRAVLGSGCGILTSKIVRGGQVVWGTPARPLKEHLRNLAYIDRLGSLLDEVKQLRARVSQLETSERPE